MDSKFKKIVFLFQRPGQLLQERLQGVYNYPEMQMLTKSTRRRNTREKAEGKRQRKIQEKQLEILRYVFPSFFN